MEYLKLRQLYKGLRPVLFGMAGASIIGIAGLNYSLTNNQDTDKMLHDIAYNSYLTGCLDAGGDKIDCLILADLYRKAMP